MRLGFQHPSPFERIPDHAFGDEEWTVTVRARGAYWIYSSIRARACFHVDNPACLYVDHPGEIGMFAQMHERGCGEGVFDSAAVARILDDAEGSGQ